MVDPDGSDPLRVFRGRRGILFDLDGTLYDAGAYSAYFEATDRVTGLKLLGCYGVDDPEAAFERLERDRRAGGHPSKSAALEALHGIGIAEMNRFRERHLHPEDLIRPDPRMARVLTALADRFTLVLGTNNAPGLMLRILACLGVPPEAFHRMLTSEDVGSAKPDPAFFAAVAACAGHEARDFVSVGDRLESDLEPARRLGMGTWLVRSPEDVYALERARPDAS